MQWLLVHCCGLNIGLSFDYLFDAMKIVLPRQNLFVGKLTLLSGVTNLIKQASAHSQVVARPTLRGNQIEYSQHKLTLKQVFILPRIGPFERIQ